MRETRFFATWRWAMATIHQEEALDFGYERGYSDEESLCTDCTRTIPPGEDSMKFLYGPIGAVKPIGWLCKECWPGFEAELREAIAGGEMEDDSQTTDLLNWFKKTTEASRISH